MYTTPTTIAGNIYVQKVTVIWTKASRGMPAADLRAKCPIAFALRDAELAQLAEQDTYASVLMHERNRFEPEHATKRHAKNQDRLDWGAVAVKFPKNQEAIVRYTYHWLSVGAPDRSGRPPLTCPIRPGELVRVEYNGRTTLIPDGKWWYTYEVFNVVLTEEPTPDQFLATPARALTDMADLW